MREKAMKAVFISGSLILALILGFVVYHYGNGRSIAENRQPDNSVPGTTIEVEPTPLPAAIKVLQRWPEPTLSPVIRNNVSITEATVAEYEPAKRYLIFNPVKFEEKAIHQYIDGANVELRYPELGGLVDRTVQDKINNDIRSYADNLLINAETYSKDLKEVRLSYYISANYNNIVCVNLFQTIMLTDDHIRMRETLLYELVNGQRLELKDVFKAGSDFPNILNKAIEKYIIQKNLEEMILKAPFKGVRAGQNFDLSESTLTIHYDKNDEISYTVMINEPNSVTFRLAQFGSSVDIFDKFTETPKKLYVSDEVKKRMLPNDMKVEFFNEEKKAGNFRTVVNGLMFTGMKNTEVQKKLNELCSETGEKEFKNILAEAPKKTYSDKETPYIIRYYGLTANYCDVISVACNQHYSIPGYKTDESSWHLVYNVKTGNKLGLQDIFKKQYEWKRAVSDYIKGETERAGLKLDGIDIAVSLAKADFWFDEEKLWINLKPSSFVPDAKENVNIFSIPFSYFGEENLVIRE